MIDMSAMELIAPCHFGLEAVLKREINDLGYEITEVDDGRVTFAGDEEAVALSNIFLRTAERILIKAGDFSAETFEELFERTKDVPWENYIPANGKFWVAKAASVKSALFSPRDIQSIIKKAMVERMKAHYHIEWFPEDGSEYPLRVFIKKNRVIIGLDTSGESLHKRGYRLRQSLAPISETLAAALLMLTPWHADRILVDPFCGCGTFPIEAALMAKNIAPGMYRSFAAMNWHELVPSKHWKDAREEAEDLIVPDVSCDIQGYDIDDIMVRMARENAKDAGVADLIHFQRREVADLHHPGSYGFIIANPPYGERIGDADELGMTYREFGDAFRDLATWSAYVITAYPDIERDFGKKADKKRKIYNGMIQSCFYQFEGPKPPKKHRSGEGNA